MAISFPVSPTTNQLFTVGTYTWMYDGEKWTIYSITPVDTTPVGVIQAYAGSSAPTGWLLAYGQAISRTTYSALYAVVGTTYGTGDGSTTFNLPDLRGRIPAGLDNMGGSAASRLTSGNSGITATTLGATGGDERVHQHTHTQNAHTHTQDSHNHTQNSHNHTQDAHGHTLWNANSLTMGSSESGTPDFVRSIFNRVAFDNYSTQWYAAPTTATNQATTATNQAATATNQSTTATNQNFGSGAAQNVQPTIVLNYIIKYGPA